MTINNLKSHHSPQFKLIPVVSLVFLLTVGAVFSQQIDSDFQTKNWKANWISVANSSPKEYGVYIFRKRVELNSKPQNFIVHVSADNKYRLYVNGNFIGLGPIRNDIEHWFYDTYDLAEYLQEGENVFSAKVWNEGSERAEAQISLRTGFIMDGEGEAAVVATDATWKAAQDTSYAPLAVQVYGYYASGPGEQIEMAKSIKGWQEPDYDDTYWENAAPIFAGVPKTKVGPYGAPNGWMLTPSTVPTLEFSPERNMEIRRAAGINNPEGPFGVEPIRISPNSKASILLDQQYLTNAYPTFHFSKGNKASLKITYAEALYGEGRSKGNRNEVEGKRIVGRYDLIVADGSLSQAFTPLNYRTYRYIQLDIETKDEEMVLEGMNATFTGYPFELRSEFGLEDGELQQILEIGWRTARLCAVDSYLDCPYYEQLQYIGDTRIQGLVSYFNSGDDRLIKNTLNQIHYSQQPEGMTFSRYPSASPQYIPPFSLWYIGMLHDYMMYGSDMEFVRQKLNSSRSVIQYFQGVQDVDGSLKTLPFWSFVDWAEGPDWRSGTPPMGEDGNSAILDLQFLLGLQYAGDLEINLGVPALGHVYLEEAENMKNTIRSKYWDANLELFADRSEKDRFSQHTNALAILSGLIQGEEARRLGQKILEKENMVEATIYFKYYIHQALVQAGRGNDYLSFLDIWRKAIDQGLTTWAEISDLDQTRSDSHAWGSSPNVEFYRTILGIDSAGPGFSKVKIEPHLGEIKEISGKIPHPKGTIEVAYRLNPNPTASIHLPQGITGEFIFGNKKYPLSSGTNNLQLD